MPFVSESQRRFMHARHPEIAKRWEKHTPKGKDLPEAKAGPRLMLATPAGHVAAPTDRAFMHVVPAKMLAVDNGAPSLIVPKPKKKRKRIRKAIDIRDLAKALPFDLAATYGASPRWETPVMPDYQSIYHQPESDERVQREREQQAVRRRATAHRNKGLFSFHGQAINLEPELRYDSDKMMSNHQFENEPRPGQREPSKVPPKLFIKRREAGTAKTESIYGKLKKKKRKGTPQRFVTTRETAWRP